MDQTINLTVNGIKYRHTVEPRLLLVTLLRDVIGLTGTHVGCDTSQCGACSVVVNGLTVKSCTYLAIQANGCEVTTIEGMSKDGQLHPLQEAFQEKHGLQCGFCTPGMIMTLYQVLERNPEASEEEIRQGIAGNICRCTGYHNIVRAALYATKMLNNTKQGKTDLLSAEDKSQRS